MQPPLQLIPAQRVETVILLLRGHRVILDAELIAMCEVAPNRPIGFGS